MYYGWRSGRILRKGYGASSINAICSSQEISKGIISHYFDTKDDLFLACVEECFALLTEAIKNGCRKLMSGEFRIL